MIAVEVEDETWRDVPAVETLVVRACAICLPSPSMGEGQGWGRSHDREGRAPEAPEPFASTAAQSPPPCPPPSRGREVDITVLLTDDASIRDLNARFRGKDVATNVLSFPAPQTAHPHLGDIALAHGVCAREAAAQGKTLADHLTHLVVHGVLHLLGWDHQADAQAEAMEAEERAILRELGVNDPYRVAEPLV